jgi:hypothetical protein
MSVEILQVGGLTPKQALLDALNDVENIEMVAITYMRRDDDYPFVTASEMRPVDLHFMGFALMAAANDAMNDS